MSRITLFKITLGISLICIVTGLVRKILHYPNSEAIIMTAVFAAIVYSLIALIEIWPSAQIKTTEKLMWTVGFIFFSWLAGPLYYFNRRKKIRTTPHSFISFGS